MADILKDKVKVILIAFTYPNGETKTFYNPWTAAIKDILSADENTDFAKMKDVDFLVSFASRMTKMSNILFINDITNAVSVVNINNTISYNLSVAWR